jgi:molecular chaperone GrpE
METKNGEVKTEPDVSEIERLQEEARREHEMYLRALADFDNFRKRVERERESSARRAKKDMFLQLLEILDAFDRGREQLEEVSSAVSEGFLAIERKLIGLLEKQGISRIASVGETFDPELHEAAGSVESDEYQPGEVVREIQPGYRWDGEVLRHARVLVAQ